MPKLPVDRINYTKPFRENVGGHLKARFRLNAKGEPMYEQHPDDRRIREYTIDVFLETPQASAIRSVDYLMDDPSFEDPEGFSDDADNQFQEEISSYGDVAIVVTVEMKDGHKYSQRAWLSNMLENGHADDMTPAVRAALERIKVY